MRGVWAKTIVFFAILGMVTSFPGCSVSPPCVGSGNSPIADIGIAKGLDVDFGGRGLTFASFPVDTAARAAFLLPDGKVLLAGSANKVLYYARFLPSGKADESFGTGGTETIPLEINIDKIQFQSTGKLLVAGIVPSLNSPSLNIYRFTIDGNLDSTFGNSGSLSVPLNTSSPYTLRALTLQTDDSIAIVSTATKKFTAQIYQYQIEIPITFTTELTLIRLTAEGAFDSSFGTNGIVENQSFQALALLDSIDAAAFAPDNSLYLAGDAFDIQEPGEHIAVAKFSPSGQIDSSFGLLGRATISTGLNHGEALSVAIQSDGKILAAGRLTYTDHVEMLLVRFNTDGHADATFASSGLRKEAEDKVEITASSLLVDGQGRIVVAGYRRENVPTATLDPQSCTTTSPNLPQTRFFIARYQADGTRDVTFGTEGRILTSFNAKQALAYTLRSQADGKIIAAGEADGSFAATRINP